MSVRQYCITGSDQTHTRTAHKEDRDRISEQPQELYDPTKVDTGVRPPVAKESKTGKPLEWTWQSVDKILRTEGVRAVADFHNAALAAELKQVRILTAALGQMHDKLAAERELANGFARHIVELDKQLAAERAKVKK